MDRFFTNVLGATVLDFPAGLLDDAEDEHDTTSRPELVAHQADALKVLLQEKRQEGYATELIGQTITTHKSLKRMAGTTGLEPAASAVTGYATIASVAVLSEPELRNLV